MAEAPNDRVEQFTIVNEWPVPILGTKSVPSGTPSATSDEVKRGTATSAVALSFTGMKEGQLWEFEFFDATAPDDNTVPPENVAYRPYNGTTAAVATDALHRTTQVMQRRIRHGQVGYSFIALSNSVIVSAVRLQ